MAHLLGRRLALGACAASLLHERVYGLAATTSACNAASPPVAARVPKTVKFGRVAGEDRGPDAMDPPRTLVDNYFWLRDDDRKDENILAHLRAENAFTEAETAHLAEFREVLYAEMLSHVQEDDETPEYRDGDFFYKSQTVKGLSYRRYVRRPAAGGPAACYLDVNEVAKTLPNPKQCDVGQVEVSPGGGKVAYAVDGTGYETYDVVARAIDTGDEETIEGTMGGIAWADDDSFYYLKPDASHRPFQVWKHRLGAPQADDVLVFEEPDELFNVASWRSLDGALVFIESESKETTELRFVDLATGELALVRRRERGVKYDAASHAPSKRLILTSNVDGLRNRALFEAPRADPATWTPLALPHSSARSLDAPLVTRDRVAVSGREHGLTQVWVLDLASGRTERLAWPDAAYSARLGTNADFESAAIRVTYSSPVAPRSTIDVGADGTRTVVKVDPVPNYDASLYDTERLEVPSRDGATKIPVTLLWRKDEARASAPVHLYGYGSYGICMDPSFSASRLPLVDRGVTYAIAHVRGGGEMGHSDWYEKAGKYLAKKNTFHDFVDVAAFLKASGRARTVCCEGRSAGGLLVGNAVNLAPDLFAACVAGVPFVDLMTTMCDPSIPLTTEEWEEWGNPNSKEYFDYMLSYSPIDNVGAGQTYPKMLLVSGLNDPRVAYWEPAKWAQVLRHEVANPRDVLLKMDLAAGHFSAADRYRYLRELAFDYAWLLDQGFGKGPGKGGAE